MNRGAFLKLIASVTHDVLFRLTLAVVIATGVMSVINQTRQLITWITPTERYFDVRRLEVLDLDLQAPGDRNAVRVYFQRHVHTNFPLMISFTSELRELGTSTPREYCHKAGTAPYDIDQNDYVLEFTRNQWFPKDCYAPPGCYENRNTWVFVIDDIHKQISKTSNPVSIYRGEYEDYCTDIEEDL